MLLVSGLLLPATARASVFSDILASFKGSVTAQADSKPEPLNNIQTMPLLTPAMNLNPAAGTGGGDIVVVDNSALVPEEGPSGTIADIEKPKNGTISIYIVREGDTLSGIAKLFGVSAGTILAANNLPSGSKLQIGQKLVILPITGINYTVKKGDTLESIAKRYGGDVAEIASYNGIDNGTLTSGMAIIIPNGEVPAPKATAATSRSSTAHGVGPQGNATQIGYYLRPIVGGTRTQGVHGYNGVDIGAPVGTPILASATGDVVIARAGGWNGGYGSYVVITHGNGSQTLYSHLSKVAVYDGEHVVQGQVIGYVGQTGLATGPHLHFEIRSGIRNPF